MSSSNRKLLENLSFQGIAEFAGKGLQAIYTIYLANVIGAEGYGIFGTAASIISYFIILVSFGIDIYGTREIANDKLNLKDYVNNIFSLRLFLALVSYLVIILISIFFINDIILQSAVLILGINIFSHATLLNWVFQGIEEMGIVAVRQVLVSIISLVLIFLLVKNFDDTLTAMAVLAFSLFLNSIIVIIYYIKKYNKISIKLDPTNWKKIAKASIPIGLYSVLISIMNNIDLTLMYVLLDKYEVQSGIYNAAFRIVVFAIVPSIVIQNAFFPQLSRSKELVERVSFMTKYLKLIYVVASLTSVLTFIYSDFLISSLLTDDYQSSIPLMKLFSFSIFVVFLNVALASTLVAWKKEKMVLYGTIFAVIFNITADLLFIPTHGAYGATVATIISEITLLLVLSYNIYKLTDRFILSYMFIILPIGILSSLPAYFYLNDSFGNIIGIISTVILFVLITHFSGFFRILDIKKMLRT